MNPNPGKRASGDPEAVLVRESSAADVALAKAAAALIEQAAAEHDIARRSPQWLAKKIVERRASLALIRPEGASADDPAAARELVGFGYWSAWENGRFVSHSGLVVRPDHQGLRIGTRLKMVLFESSRRQLPRAAMMSLTTSEPVRALNLSLGFRVVPFEQLTEDPSFWEGCRTCRNFAAVQERGERCCCEAMLRAPDEAQECE